MVPNEFKDILKKINIDKSDEALKAAEMMIRENMLFTALNRIYYACFYTVTALAEINDFKTSKHSSMLGWFHKNFVFEGKTFTKEQYKVYEQTFRYRLRGDYDTLYTPSMEETTDLLAKAKSFIETVREYISLNE
jgi:uncharacterized protein (UPF0332 family)